MRVESDDPKVVHCSRLKIADKEGRLRQLYNGLPHRGAKVLLLNLSLEGDDIAALGLG